VAGTPSSSWSGDTVPLNVGLAAVLPPVAFSYGADACMPRFRYE
jgi:hypothetical protein